MKICTIKLLRACYLIVLLCVFSLAPKLALGAVWFVDESVKFSGEGTSWNTAFKTLQEALDIADDQDEIRTRQGDEVQIYTSSDTLPNLKGSEPFKSDITPMTSDNSSISEFDISFIYDQGASNVLGLAVNPTNGNIFLSSLSYGGQDNLWEFTSNGTLIYSTRANWITGPSGNIGELTIANNGHLFVNAARDIDPPDGSFERYVIEMSQDGTTIFSSFSTTHYFGGKYGITYDPDNNHLLIASGRVNEEFLIRETTIDGTQLNSYALDPFLWPGDIAFDPFTESIFAVRSKIILQYKKKGKKYRLINTYDFGAVGITTPLAMDINRSNGLFYIQDNNLRVVEFDRTQLGMEPVPSDLLDLDIAKFTVTKKVSVSSNNRYSVEIKLVVRNNGTVDGGEIRDATVIGLQNSIEIYNETKSVWDPIGGKATNFQFPDCIPTPDGDIVWTVTVDDDDPDVDEAVAYTTVRP